MTMADTLPAELTRLAQACSALLFARKETIAVSESSAGGLVSAALLSVPGASAYFLGGSVTYARPAARVFMGIEKLPEGMRSSSEPYAALMATRVRERLGATWGLCETGAAGPTGNSYGDAAGHSCMATAGPIALVRTIETERAGREANMVAFAIATLILLHTALAEAR
jgi:nicotinamide-nucleotide amidase